MPLDIKRITRAPKPIHPFQFQQIRTPLMESTRIFPKDMRIWWSTLPGKAGKRGANAGLVGAPAAKKILFATENFRPIYRRHHQNGLVCAGLAHEPRAISPQYSSKSRFGTSGPKLQTVTLSLKTHSSISVSMSFSWHVC